MARANKGQAICMERRTPQAMRAVRGLLDWAKRHNDLATWRRAKAILGYIGGISVINLSAKLDVTRGSINRWLQAYDAQGVDGLRPTIAPGGPPRLTPEQQDMLVALIDSGPQACGFTAGLWTGPMIGQLIWQWFQVTYHNHHIPRLLHRLGYSVQRPRKRLARADPQKQAQWLRRKFPWIKKKPSSAAA